MDEGLSASDCIFALTSIKFHLENCDTFQTLYPKEYREELAKVETAVIDRVISILKGLE